MERLQQQMKFILEVDKVKQIIRQTYLADGSRKEMMREHSWHSGSYGCVVEGICQ